MGFDCRYFQPKAASNKNTQWNDENVAKLVAGIQQFGVGEWEKIQAHYFKGWDEMDLRMKTCRLLGRQDLRKYHGWKGDRAAMELEYEKNRSEGTSKGLWKFGVFLNEEFGLLVEEPRNQSCNEANVVLK